MVLGVGWLVWMAVGDERVQFLTPGAAPWIVYPSPFDGELIDPVEMSADFRRSFALAQKPARAMLEWRCFREGKVMVNGKVVEQTAAGNWKRTSRADVAPFLRQGTNEIEVVVMAATGPPLLTARLRTDDETFVTDEKWDVSYAGALRLPARLATAAPENLPGNEMPGGGRTIAAFGEVWAYEILFLTLASAAVWRWRRSFRARTAGVLFALAWVILLCHNMSLIRFCTGFDANAHLQYIDFILKNGKLPRASDGWEMFQPPLYYLISAGFLRALGLEVFSASGMAALHIVNALAGAANVALIYWGMRLIFPGDVKKQLAGAVLGAFAPCQLYLLHFPTNEVLMATMATLSLCFCLKCLEQEPISIWWRVGLGVALGAACCTKASAIALFPAVFGALGLELLAQREKRVWVWARDIVMVGALAVAIAGWHYFRVANNNGNLLAGLLPSGGLQTGWQQTGYLTAKYFLSFGRALSAPYFAGIHGFWDSLYGTFWGDGQWGGQLQYGSELWNFSFMTAGFVLALPLALLIGSGLILLTVRWMREPRSDTLLLFSVPATYLFALAEITLKYSAYQQAKAVFALAALLPLCVCAVTGWEYWAARGKAAGMIILTVAGLFWLNNYAAFWIRSDSAHFRLCRALADYQTMRANAPGDFQDVLAVDPENKTAEMYLAMLSRTMGETNQSEEYLKKAIAEHPDDAKICGLAADFQARANHWKAALPLAAQAAEMAPDDYQVALIWMRLAREMKRDGDVVEAGELVLRDRPALMEAHRAMAEALAHLGRPAEAALHARIASEAP